MQWLNQRKIHPERNPTPETTRQFQVINEAYQALGDPQSRAGYDAEPAPQGSDTSPFGVVSCRGR